MPTDISLTVSMSNFRKKSSGHSTLSSIRKTLTVLGCLFSLFSLIFPFCYVLLIFPLGPLESWSTYYWSYSVDSHNVYTTVAPSIAHYWFFDYWFNQSYVGVGLGIPWILILLFTVQVLTLIFGVIFISSSRRILSFEPIMFSIAVVALMTYTGWVISGDTGVLSFQYQLGYYLIYPAMVVFLFAFLLNQVSKNGQTTNTEILSTSQLKTN